MQCHRQRKPMTLTRVINSSHWFPQLRFSLATVILLPAAWGCEDFYLMPMPGRIPCYVIRKLVDADGNQIRRNLKGCNQNNKYENQDNRAKSGRSTQGTHRSLITTLQQQTQPTNSLNYYLISNQLTPSRFMGALFSVQPILSVFVAWRCRATII